MVEVQDAVAALIAVRGARRPIEVAGGTILGVLGAGEQDEEMAVGSGGGGVSFELGDR